MQCRHHNLEPGELVGRHVDRPVGANVRFDAFQQAKASRVLRIAGIDLAVLLDHAGHPAEAATVRRGVEGAWAAGLRTADLGGTATPQAFTDAVLDHAAIPA